MTLYCDVALGAREHGIPPPSSNQLFCHLSYDVLAAWHFWDTAYSVYL
jgi:hypothetical protein